MLVQVVTRFFEHVWNAQDIQTLDDLTAENVVMTDSCCWQDAYVGRDRVRRVIEEYLGAYKGITYTLQEVLGNADGSVVMVRWHANAMHLGGFMGGPPSGRVEEISGMSTFRLQGDKICRIEQFREHLAHERPGVHIMDGL